MNIDAVVRRVQEKLGVSVDGNPGQETWGAIQQAIIGKPVPKSATFAAKADDRSEKIIATLQPEVAPYVRTLVERVAAAGIQIKAISGTRTYAEQDALFAIGRIKALHRKPVTNAKGGESNHNFGIAIDVGIFEGKAYLGESPLYATVGATGMDLGLEWAASGIASRTHPIFSCAPNGRPGCQKERCSPDSAVAQKTRTPSSLRCAALSDRYRCERRQMASALLNSLDNGPA